MYFEKIFTFFNFVKNKSEFRSRMLKQGLKPCKIFIFECFKSTPNSTTVNNCYDDTNKAAFNLTILTILILQAESKRNIYLRIRIRICGFIVPQKIKSNKL